MNKILNKVAVYGSLRKGLHNHCVLEDSPLLGTFVSKPEWTMLSLGSFPALVPGGDTPIVMEVYEVDPEVFASLDMLEGYPSFYDRETIETPMGDAWVYFLADAEGYGNTIVPSGDWMESITFTQKESVSQSCGC